MNGVRHMSLMNMLQFTFCIALHVIYFVQLSDQSSSTGVKYLLYFLQIIFNHAVLNNITL